MATDVQQPVKPSPAGKYEAFVHQQLSRARSRIRLLDFSAAFLGLAALTLFYALVCVLADRWLDLPIRIRQAAFFGYALGLVIYLGFVLVRPLFWWSIP